MFNLFYIKRLRDELDRVLGAREQITFEQLNELKYTRAVIKESLRLWPPVPQVTRELAEPLNINGIVVPKGAWVQVGTYLSGRCEEFFPKAHEFNPERFYRDGLDSEK